MGKRKKTTLSIADGHGNVWVSRGVPAGYEHVRGNRVQRVCQELDIKFAAAVVACKEPLYGRGRIKDGVVVTKKSAAKLRQILNDLSP